MREVLIGSPRPVLAPAGANASPVRAPGPGPSQAAHPPAAHPVPVAPCRFPAGPVALRNRWVVGAGSVAPRRVVPPRRLGAEQSLSVFASREGHSSPATDRGPSGSMSV